jgi:cytochrome c5
MSSNTTQRRSSGVFWLFPALALLMLLGAGCSDKETTAPGEAATEQAPAVEPEATPPADTPEPAAETEAAPPAEAPEPAAAEPQAAAEEPTAAVDGEKIYQASCQVCHAAGVAGAPKLADKAAWAPRIAKGNDALLASVTNGLNAMPPKGACMTCSEDDLRAAVEYMIGQGS